ncbi:TPA: histidine kinase dimerization/phospho-acceptor domain-containing protein, partial [Shigella sonnei]
RLLGLPAEVKGRQYAQVFTDSPLLLEMIASALQEAKTNHDTEWWHPHPERGLLCLNITTSIWRGPLDEVLGVIIMIEDRTEWKQLESRLAQAERLAVIGEWATSIAHEVRNPLTSIKAFTQIIEEDLPSEHDSREYTGIIMEEVERLNRFADELL